MRTLGLIITIIGIIGVLVFTLADVLNLGADPDRFGNRQIIGTVVFVLVFLIGLILYQRKQPPQAQ
jgi:hypothetical protein